ncbi:MAG: cytochrome-c peroxidase [Gammaproteobacteria bacterium]|nr:cytochrome-c peroxidase [Gammaproteobacteria bacterium]
MRYRYHFMIVGLLVVLATVYLASNRQMHDTSKEILPASVEVFKGFNAEQIQPLPSESNLPEDKITLGNLLFHDPRLSQDNTISCASCHDLSKGGTDRSPSSVGMGGSVGNVNAPTVFNSGFNFVQFWDGRAGTLEEQASGPVHNPIEMGSNWNEVLLKLRADDKYQLTFGQIYSDGITSENIVDAIATFERSLVTPNSAFDRFLLGDDSALTQEQQEGFQRFKDYGCISCHQGINMGGNMFQRFGVVEGYFEGKTLTKADLGRFNVTGLEEDMHVFKVPSLRNIAVTAPYLHNGSAKTLNDVIIIMGRYQLGRKLSTEDLKLIKSFLQSLTGEWQGKTLQ